MPGSRAGIPLLLVVTVIPLLSRTRARARHLPSGLLLALQGGGAHGAYTWGVLDALLEAGLQPAALSGTSAGAMNAAVLAHGWLRDGADGARQALADFWQALGALLPIGLLTVGEGDETRLLPMARWLLHWSAQWLSPYDTNPRGLNPLRDLLAQQLDVERLRAPDALPLVIATTDTASGRLRCLRNAELSLDALLASACLPTLHHAVALDGRPHWDGGFAANPALLPLIDAHPARDLLLVLLLPLQLGPEPRNAAQIRQRVGEIGFVSGLRQELQWLARLQHDAAEQWWPRGLAARVATLRWHCIDGGERLQRLAPDSRLIAHGPFLQQLCAAGRADGERWCAEHRSRLGRHGSVQLQDLARR